MWSTSLSMDASATHLQTQKCRQNTCGEWTGVSDKWTRIYRTMQNSVGQRNWCGVGGNKGVSRTRPALGRGAGGGTEAGFQSPHWALSESQEKYLRLRVNS